MAVIFQYVYLFVTGNPAREIKVPGISTSRDVTLRGVFRFDDRDVKPPSWPEEGIAFTLHVEMQFYDSNWDIPFKNISTHRLSGYTTSNADKYSMTGDVLLPNLTVGVYYKFQIYISFTVCDIADMYGGCARDGWREPSMASQWIRKPAWKFMVVPP